MKPLTLPPSSPATASSWTLRHATPAAPQRGGARSRECALAKVARWRNQRVTRFVRDAAVRRPPCRVPKMPVERVFAARDTQWRSARGQNPTITTRPACGRLCHKPARSYRRSSRSAGTRGGTDPLPCGSPPMNGSVLTSLEDRLEVRLLSSTVFRRCGGGFPAHSPERLCAYAIMPLGGM